MATPSCARCGAPASVRVEVDGSVLWLCSKCWRNISCYVSGGCRIVRARRGEAANGSLDRYG